MLWKEIFKKRQKFKKDIHSVNETKALKPKVWTDKRLLRSVVFHDSLCIDILKIHNCMMPNIAGQNLAH